ncbi:thiol-disulfide oxidoreductase DCC family protein [Williamsia sp. MIQD14]|uniref:thiol-disulfide oxidoreductase DCC family protein n=1 Tax=Williamsia sp. MIQD14 TaxID=3425703 RepID=UPI003D9FDF9C
MSPTPGVLYFDGDCGMCTRARDLLQRLNRTGKVRTEPLQSAGTADRVGATPESLMESVWWLGDDGTVYSAAHAANAAVAAALGTSLPLRVYRIPGVHQAQEAAYRWVATHRQYFPGVTPHCQDAPADCR